MEGQGTNNSNNARWGRRAFSTSIWAILLTVAYYVCIFKGQDFNGWIEYARYMTYGLGFLVGGLTITDVILKKQ